MVKVLFDNCWQISENPNDTLQICTVKLQWKRVTCKKCTLYKYLPYTVQCRSYSKKTVNQLYIYSTVLGAAIKCKQYSEITVESVKITLKIFAVCLNEQRKTRNGVAETHPCCGLRWPNLGPTFITQFAAEKLIFDAATPELSSNAIVSLLYLTVSLLCFGVGWFYRKSFEETCLILIHYI